MENNHDSIDTISNSDSACGNCKKGTRARNGILLWAYYTARGEALNIDRLRGQGYTHRPGAWHRVCRACASVVSCTEDRFWPSWGDVDNANASRSSVSDVPSAAALSSDPVADMNEAMENVREAKRAMEAAREALAAYDATMQRLRADLANTTGAYEQAKIAYSRAAKRLADTF